jgi:hypothetical protein
VKQWLATGKPTQNPVAVGNTAGVPGDIHPVYQAVQQFIDQRVVHPKAGNAPLWASDPHYRLLAQLKGFIYNYGNVVSAGTLRYAMRAYDKARAEGKSDPAAYVAASLPIIQLGMFIAPLSMAAIAAKETIKGVGRDDKDKKQSQGYWLQVARMSGVFGPGELAVQMAQDAGNGKGAFVSLLGPAANNVDTLFQYGPLSPEFAKRTLPLGTTFPGIWDAAITKARAERAAAQAE